MGFIKAPPGAVTRYLWVGGVHGMSVRQLAELFVPYGSPSVILPDAGTSSTSTPPAPQPDSQEPPSPGASQPLSHHPTMAPPGPTCPSPTHQPMPYYHAFLAFEAEGDAAAAVAAVPYDAPWAAAGGRKLVLKYADVRCDKRPVPRPVSTCTSDLGVPGLVLLKEWVTPEHEQQLLAAIKGAEGEGEGVTAVEAAAGAGAAERLTAAEKEEGAAAVGEEERGGRGGGRAGGGGWVVMARRRVQHYGYRFDYSTRNVDLVRPLGPLPPWAEDLTKKMAALPEVGQPLDQLTVNEYESGVGLAPHVDTHSAFTGPIVVLSLGSHTVMEMRRGEVARPLLLPARSLLVMSGEARYAWQHYIPHRVADLVADRLMPRGRRVSLTFRKVRGFPCDCAYPDSCDSQQASLPPTRISLLDRPPPHAAAPQQKDTPAAAEASTCVPPPTNDAITTTNNSSTTTAATSSCDDRGGDGAAGGRQEGGAAGAGGGGAGNDTTISDTGAGGDSGGDEGSGSDEAGLAALEAEFVHKVYDAIAPHFSATRFAIWPRVRCFIESLPVGGLVADVGCGNGKYFGVRRDLAVIGSDISASLAAVAATRLRPTGLPSTAAPPAADALVADALDLPYRPASVDGVLCIAVLHHLSSPSRRRRLLRQLLRLLRPGGRALVTVWATEQEEPAKTLAKWRRIPAPRGGKGMEAAEAGEATDVGGEVGRDARVAVEGSGGVGNPGSDLAVVGGDVAGGLGACYGSGSEEDSGGGGGDRGGGGADYLVPWHLPFHRTEAAAAARAAKKAAADGAASGPGRRRGGSSVGPDDGAPVVDATKGAVVFQRYYHLFTREELLGLVEEVLMEGPEAEGGVGDEPWGSVEEVFYDRSNWCIVFRTNR